jgi:hypothetical protein
MNFYVRHKLVHVELWLRTITMSSISRSLSAVVTPELCELGNMSKAVVKAGPGTPRAWRAALRGGPAFLLRRGKKAPSLLRLRRRRGYLALS